MTLYAIIIIFVLGIVLCIVATALQYKKVGPNEVLVITGGRKRKLTMPDGTEKSVGYRLRIGGGTFIIPLLESSQTLDLQNIPMNFVIDDIISANGIKSSITGTAQVKVNGSEPAVHIAAEQFLGKSLNDIKEIALTTIEGHVRALVGTVDLETLNKSRRDFNEKIFQETESDFNRMGLRLIAFNLKDIKDPAGYLEALGKPVIANARRDAEVAQSEATRDATIKAAEAKKEGDVAKLIAETELAKATKDYETKKAQFQAEINEKKAYADYVYDFERQKMNQKVKEETHKLALLEKEHAIDLAQKEIIKAEHELESNVRKPAEAEKFRLIQEAEAMAEAKKIQGKVEAELTFNQGKADADAMLQKADAWKQYNSAAMLHELIEILPKLAREIAEPLSKIEKIVMVNNGGTGSGMSKITGEVAEVLAQLPTVVQSLSGLDMQKMLARLSDKDTAHSSDSVD